jgi:hypothetical protein
MTPTHFEPSDVPSQYTGYCNLQITVDRKIAFVLKHFVVDRQRNDRH